ncbi:MAG: zinc-ribbon domain-containing protein [candidate division NC10 bacterium]|nr:zinc-ribbon domain-containing protein [candidate division NC10 bacterium]
METILVIDDELFMRRLCDDMLALRGFKVLTAENAKEGLAKIEKGGIDVILLDIMMPDLTGIEFLPVIKKTDPDVFVIIITAYASLETAIEALKKGAYDYIRKPFRPHELYHSVDKAIGRRRIELENKRLLQDLQGKVKELSTLNRVGKYIHSLLEIDRLLEKIVLSIAAVMGVEIVSIMLVDKETNEMTIRASTGLPEDVVKTTRQPVGTGIAGWVAEKGEPLLINDVEKDPRFNKMVSDAKYKTKSLLSVPLVSKGGVLGVINVNRKTSGETFTDHDLQLLATFSSQAAAAIENADLYARVKNFNAELEEKVRQATAELAQRNRELERAHAELRENYVNTLRSLVATLEARDEYTRNHSERVTRLASLIAKEMGFTEKQMSALRIGGMLHDVGKIGVPDEILKSADKMTPEQRRLMESHPEIGARIVEPIPFLRGVKEIIYQHQERYDGSGYPQALKGEAIVPEARVLAVADAYDAMISRRRYRSKVYTHPEVVEELKRAAGAQLDPTAVAAFCRLDQAAVEALYAGVAPASEPPRGTTGVQGRPAPPPEAPPRPLAPAPVMAPPPEPGPRPASAPAPAVVAAPAPRPVDGQDTVQCQCPKCQASFRIKAAAIPPGGARIRCPRCGEGIPVRPAGGSAGRIAFVT